MLPCRHLHPLEIEEMLAGFQVFDTERADNFLSLDHVTRVDSSLLRARSWGRRRHRCILCDQNAQKIDVMTRLSVEASTSLALSEG